MKVLYVPEALREVNRRVEDASGPPISRPTLYRWLQSGRIPHVGSLKGRLGRYAFTPDDIEWIIQYQLDKYPPMRVGRR